MDYLGHFKTITSHKLMVMKYCFRVGLYRQGLLHDLSKYSPTEFWRGAKYYQGTRSPNAREREIYGHSKAWLHHKGRNRHHFEYWRDFNPVTKKTEPVEMPTKYFKEMVCDRIAASKIYNGKDYKDGDAITYYKKESYLICEIHPNTAAHLEKVLQMLADNGEKEVFEYLRKLK